MLILKGNAGKSRVIDILMEQTGSVCFVYNDYPLIFNAICVDSKEYSLDDFFNEIEFMFEKDFATEYFQYLLIYTNEKERSLKRYLKWLEDNRQALRCGQIIITCRE